jgi:arylsulfatase A-like enzyme
MKNPLNFIVVILMILFLAACGTKKSEEEGRISPPNIIYILADDLGYGDLGSYGQEIFATPNLDILAEQGMRFTRHYSGSTVCAPSRSVLMTGLHTGHTPIRGNREVKPEGQAPLPDTAFTIAEMLKQAGYTTGAFGKWGLGYPGSEGDPLNQGFDVFFGYNCQRYAHRYYPEYLWENDRKVYLEGNDWIRKQSYAPDLIHEKTLDFIRQHKKRPFFAFVPIVLPHAELIVPEDEIYESFAGLFPEEAYQGGPGADYGPEMKIPAYCSQPFPKATFAAMVLRIDRYVGEILAVLKEEGLSENTVVMFTSDNGPHMEGGASPAFFNSSGGLRGVKRDLYEGGIRVPFIVSWLGKIQAGSSTDHISAFWDVLPTIAELAGLKPPANDGISFLPALTGKEQPQHHYLYWEFHERGGKQAVLKAYWKAVRLGVRDKPEGRVELYQLENDPGETRDLAEVYPEIAGEMEKIMDEAHEPSPTFNFGRPASGR